MLYFRNTKKCALIFMLLGASSFASCMNGTGEMNNLHQEAIEVEDEGFIKTNRSLIEDLKDGIEKGNFRKVNNALDAGANPTDIISVTEGNAVSLAFQYALDSAEENSVEFIRRMLIFQLLYTHNKSISLQPNPFEVLQKKLFGFRIS